LRQFLREGIPWSRAMEKTWQFKKGFV